MRVLISQRVPSEGGIELATDVYLPDGAGAWPVVITRTPYMRVGHGGHGKQFTDRGYAYVVQDVRGKYDSTGVFDPLRDEAADGQATIDWAANQRWCNGRVGMWGRSYLGIVQVPAAAGGHEALKCIVPSVCPGSFFRDWARYDGCFAWANLVRWLFTHTTVPNKPPMSHIKWDRLFALDNVDAVVEATGAPMHALRAFADHDRDDPYWQAIDQTLMHDQVRVPGCHVGGFFDHISNGVFEAYHNIAGDQRLLVGPWGHMSLDATGPGKCYYGDMYFGPRADFDVFAHEMRFMDCYLRDIDDGFADEKPVKVFVIGANRWIDLDAWPPTSNTQDWHLGAGSLDREQAVNDGEDAYTYDPRNPTPTWGGQTYWGVEPMGPVDQRPLIDRDDVLLYRSEPLPTPLTAIGDPRLELFIATDVDDTDFVVKLCVEHATGETICLSLGSLRCRYRNSFADPQPLPRDEPVKLSVRLAQLAHVFPAGSRIALTITSSDYPRILPHRNRMGLFDEPTVARNRVLHGPAAPSRLILPIVDL